MLMRLLAGGPQLKIELRFKPLPEFRGAVSLQCTHRTRVAVEAERRLVVHVAAVVCEHRRLEAAVGTLARPLDFRRDPTSVRESPDEHAIRKRGRPHRARWSRIRKTPRPLPNETARASEYAESHQGTGDHENADEHYGARMDESPQVAPRQVDASKSRLVQPGIRF